MERLRRWCGGLWTAMLTGAFFLLVIGRLDAADPKPVGSFLVFGALYGVAVLGLIRLLGARSWGHVVAGLLSGPVPAAVLSEASADAGERGGMALATALLGVMIGLMEWQRRARIDVRK